MPQSRPRGLLPSQFEEISDRAELKAFLAEHIDMYFADVRDLLRLPVTWARLPAGANMATANALFSAIAGCSVLFWNAGPDAFKPPYENKSRFKGALSFMPWDPVAGGMTKEGGLEFLYTYARNPLAHAFGLDYDHRKATGEVPAVWRWSVQILKASMTKSEIWRLETSAELPTGVGPPLTKTHPHEYAIDVGGLYWGIHRMLHALLRDSEQLQATEAMAIRFRSLR